MSNCEDKKKAETDNEDICCPSEAPCCSPSAKVSENARGALAHFDRMIENCLKYASAAKNAGRPIVGIMCEYTPRELILAAGGVPVCLCGGSADMIPPAEEDLPANLCPLIKSSYGYHKQKSNPFLEMAHLIVAETTCDGKKKMFELMGLTRDMYVLELPQKQDDPDAMEHWVRELHKLKAELERRFDTKITHERLGEAVVTMNRERMLRRDLAGLMASDNPPLTGRQILDAKSIISCMPSDFEQYERALEFLRDQHGDSSIASRIRVLMTGVPLPHGAERVMDIIEGNRGLVVCMENCTGLKPLLDDVDPQAEDLLRAIAEKYFHLPCSVMTKNDGRLESLRALAAKFRPQCIIELVWQACLTYDVESYRIKDLAENELGLPYMRIETDYSPSDSARIAVRIEALFETIRATREQHG